MANNGKFITVLLSSIIPACTVLAQQESGINNNVNLAEFDCGLLAAPEATIDGGLSLIKNFVDANEKRVSFDPE